MHTISCSLLSPLHPFLLACVCRSRLWYIFIQVLLPLFRHSIQCASLFSSLRPFLPAFSSPLSASYLHSDLGSCILSLYCCSSFFFLDSHFVLPFLSTLQVLTKVSLFFYPFVLYFRVLLSLSFQTSIYLF